MIGQIALPKHLFFIALIAFASPLTADIGPYEENNCTIEIQGLTERSDCETCSDLPATADKDKCSQKFKVPEYNEICRYERPSYTNFIFCKESDTEVKSDDKNDEGGCSINQESQSRIILSSISIFLGLLILLIQIRKKQA